MPLSHINTPHREIPFKLAALIVARRPPKKDLLDGVCEGVIAAWTAPQTGQIAQKGPTTFLLTPEREKHFWHQNYN
jgi:hypothetical protein